MNKCIKFNKKFFEKTWRYVCPHCLRTFLSNEYDEDLFCWECGEGLIVIPKREEKEDENNI